MSNYYVGIDLGGTRVKIGMVKDGVVVSRKIIPADAAGGLGASLGLLEREIEVLIGSSALAGIGLAFPGLVDPVSQRILSTNQKYDDAMGVDVPAWVREKWGVPFYIDNDARMAAVGEWKYGAGRDTDDLVIMTIGTGIGTSAIMGGKLLRGRHHQAGCLGGHLSIRYDGRPCNCGNIGCVEAYGSTWSLGERVRTAEGFEKSMLAGAAVIDYVAIFEAADQGDVLARRVREDCVEVWAAGVVNLVHAYDPEVVVLGGGVMGASHLLEAITEKVHRHAWTPWGKVAIRPAELESDAGIAGVVYCLQNQL